MKFSKDLGVMKALVESILRRDHTDEGEHDVEIALKVMSSMIPEGKFYVAADGIHFVNDFSKAIKRNCTFIADRYQTMGLEDVHVVVLHTRHRVAEQKEKYVEIREHLRACKGINIWHIGKWRRRP